MNKSLTIVLLLIFTCNLVFATNFEVNTLSIKSSVARGDSSNFPISILNSGDSDLFDLAFSSEGNFIQSNYSEVFLDKGEGLNFEILLDSKNLREGVYTGEIVISSSEEDYKIPVIFEVESQSVYFDSITDIAPKFSRIVPGSVFEANVKVFSLNLQEGNVNVVFGIKDLQGNIIFQEENDLVVKSQKEIKKEFVIPENSNEGDYVFFVIVKDKDSGFIGTSSSDFSVTNKRFFELQNSNLIYFIIAILIFLIISFIVVNYFWSKKLIDNSRNWRRKLGNIKSINYSDISKRIGKLEYQKSLLKKAYDKGYIKVDSYRGDLKDINSLILKLKKRL